jgi:hypothetical protein
MSETIDIKEPPAALPYHHACELGMEGIVAKRIDAPYRSGTCKAVSRSSASGASRCRSIAAIHLGRPEAAR